MISIISEAAIEIGIKNMFDRKGIITCTKSISLEQAEELAIEFGAEEVEEEDEILNFYTSPIGNAQLIEKFVKLCLHFTFHFDEIFFTTKLKIRILFSKKNHLKNRETLFTFYFSF